MLPSGNDAAVALAKWGGNLLIDKNPNEQEKDNVKVFLNFMNKTAKELNMKNSRFYNPHGLPNYQSGSTP